MGVGRGEFLAASRHLGGCIVKYHRIAAAVLLASSVLAPALQVAPVAAASEPSRLIQASGSGSLVGGRVGTDGGGGPELRPDAFGETAGPAPAAPTSARPTSSSQRTVNRSQSAAN